MNAEEHNPPQSLEEKLRQAPEQTGRAQAMFKDLSTRHGAKVLSDGWVEIDCMGCVSIWRPLSMPPKPGTMCERVPVATLVDADGRPL